MHKKQIYLNVIITADLLAFMVLPLNVFQNPNVNQYNFCAFFCFDIFKGNRHLITFDYYSRSDGYCKIKYL